METTTLETDTCVSSGHNDIQVQPPKKRKSYDIWARLNQAESISELTEKLDTVEVDSSYVRIERGPESYYIRKDAFSQSVRKKQKVLQNMSKKKRAKKRKLKSTSFDSNLEDGELPESEESDCSVSSGGISDDSLRQLRKNTKPKFRKSKKKRNRKHDTNLLYSEDTQEGFVSRLSSELQEFNVSLLRDIVNVVGIPEATKIASKVMKIEKRGGLMIKDGSRRRTPGGVFFYLIQRHPKTKSDTLTALLQSHNKAKISQRPKRKAKRRLNPNLLGSATTFDI